MNEIRVIGRLGKDIELRKTIQGKSVIEFSLADSEKIDGAEYTTWINCVAWDKRAENIQKYVRKGDMLFVGGKWKNNEYLDKNGNKVYRTYCLVTTFQLLPNARGNKAPEENYNPFDLTNEYQSYQSSLGGQLQTPEETERNHITYIDEFEELPFR